MKISEWECDLNIAEPHMNLHTVRLPRSWAKNLHQRLLAMMQPSQRMLSATGEPRPSCSGVRAQHQDSPGQWNPWPWFDSGQSERRECHLRWIANKTPETKESPTSKNLSTSETWQFLSINVATPIQLHKTLRWHSPLENFDIPAIHHILQSYFKWLRCSK